MKRIITQLAILAVAILPVSCSKDLISPEELFNNEAKVAKTKIHTKSGNEDSVTTFRDKIVYRYSDTEGQSWFTGYSGGKMSYDAFLMSVYFDDVERMTIGHKLNIRSFNFGFFFSSDSNAYTNKYSGSITLADKGDDYVILRFDNFKCSCSLGDCVTNGYLYCQLKDRIIPIYE
jgi:hypothetical protein